MLVATSREYALNSIVIVGRDRGVLLVDPGWPRDELDDLANELAARSLTPVAGFATHALYDHLLWHPAARFLAGDLLSDIELPLPDDSPNALVRYRAGLEVRAPYASAARLVIPGHGSITSKGEARVTADLDYLDELANAGSSADTRATNPEMAEVHAANVVLASEAIRAALENDNSG